MAHIALSVSDLGKSIAFYGRLFGFKCSDVFDDKTSTFKIALLKKDQVTLELFQFQQYNPLPEYRKDLDNDLKTLGVKHFAFEVDAIEKIHRQLKNSRVEVVSGINVFHGGLRYFFIKDSDGILIELIEAGK